MRFGRQVVAGALALQAVCLVPSSDAAEPGGGRIDQATPQVTWSGGPLPFTTLRTGCQPATPQCDRFNLTIGTLPDGGPDVLISAAGGSDSDVLSMYVYGPDGGVAGEDTNLTPNPRITLHDPVPGTYTVFVEALLGTGGPVSYDAVAAATDAGDAPDPEVPCNGVDGGFGPPPVEVLRAALDDDGRVVQLDVLVLLDGVSLDFAASFFERVAIPYAELGIDVVPTFQALPVDAITSNVTTEIIEQTKDLLPGRRVPDEFDVVELLTHRNIEALGIDAVAGQAECIGGAAYKEHSFIVSEAQADEDQAGIRFGPLLLVPDVAAKITAHEIGHLFGGQHHFANCVEGLQSDAVSGGDSSPCSLMFNTSDFMSLHFGTVNGRIVRGYALLHAAANDGPALSAAVIGG